MIASHRDVRWIFNPEVSSWHGLDDELGLPLCGTSVPEDVEIHAELPAEILRQLASASVFETPLCAACARLVKLHRG